MKTIKSSKEISSIFDEGNKLHTSELLIVVKKPCKKGINKGRVAFIAGKKNGNSVWRNKAKRRLRNIYKDLGFLFLDYDVLFVAKKPVLKTKYSLIIDKVRQTLEKFCYE